MQIYSMKELNLFVHLGTALQDTVLNKDVAALRLLDIKQNNMNLGFETSCKNSETQRSPSFPELERIDIDFGYGSSQRDSRTPSLPDIDELYQSGSSSMPAARNVYTPLSKA
ncbi:hypothetical protein O0L34_g19363 [Tuta absoluta]|nr:hypothetical protein O0L34_g19363 [Tuta absoluta]